MQCSAVFSVVQCAVLCNVQISQPDLRPIFAFVAAPPVTSSMETAFIVVISPTSWRGDMTAWSVKILREIWAGSELCSGLEMFLLLTALGL